MILWQSRCEDGLSATWNAKKHFWATPFQDSESERAPYFSLRLRANMEQWIVREKPSQIKRKGILPGSSGPRAEPSATFSGGLGRNPNLGPLRSLTTTPKG